MYQGSTRGVNTMSTERPYIKVAARFGEVTKNALSTAGVFDPQYKIVQEDDSLYIPLQYRPERVDLEDILGTTAFEIGTKMFPVAVGGPRTLSETLEAKLSPEELALLPRAYDLVGDIAVLELPEPLTEHAKQIGEAFLAIHPNFSTILAKKGAIAGTTRVRGYDLLAGEDKTQTVHIEYGCRIAVDLAVAYFSPRLLEEHQQIAKQVKDQEVILDMFTGVGPFALHIAKARKARVIAVDINEQAIALLQKSMTMNRFRGNIEPVAADVRTYIQENTQRDIDRVIMNHPSAAFDFVPDACHALKEKGVMHYYDFISGANPEAELSDKITNLVEHAGRTVLKISRIRRVRDSAPYEYQMAVDLIIG
jgi:tRNA (guanine37-N1)-methyltransferase